MMEYRGGSMHISIQAALNDFCSSRSSSSRRTRALATLEQQLALAFVSTIPDDTLSTFLWLQDTFECNIPSRLLSWISCTLPRVELFISKGLSDKEREKDVFALSAHISQSLSIIQGVVLNHKASKQYLGSRYALEILIDLLLVSRHIPLSLSTDNVGSASTLSAPKTSTQGIQSHLSSTVLDTLLCILVDAPASLRVFEEANGVQAIVKILKRAGTPRGVRMKCLEFIYFYLMDEDSSTAIGSFIHSSSTSSHSAPTSPTSTSFPSTVPTTSTSTFTVLQGDTPTPTTPKPNTKARLFPRPPPIIGSAVLHGDAKPQPLQRSLLMLRKDVDYVPLSPIKPPATSTETSDTTPTNPRKDKMRRLLTPSPHVRSQSISYVDSEDISISTHLSESASNTSMSYSRTSSSHSSSSQGITSNLSRLNSDTQIKSTEEKKAFLGTLLGNVDALVDGVRKAGVWGLA